MGGGTSVLSPDLSKVLTKKSLEQFHLFQLECEEKKLLPIDMYILLTKKYDELINMEKDMINFIQLNTNINLNEEIIAGSNSSLEKRQPPSVPSLNMDSLHPSHSKINTNRAAPSSRSGTTRDHSSSSNSSSESNSKKNSIDFTSKKLEQALLATNIEYALEQEKLLDEEENENENKDDINDMNLINDPYIESIMEKVFQSDSFYNRVVEESTKAETLSRENSSLSTPNSARSNKSPPMSSRIDSDLYDKHDVELELKREKELNKTENSTDTSMFKLQPNEKIYVYDNAFLIENATCGSFRCLVCQLNLESRKTMEIHIKHSPLHKLNSKIKKDLFQTTMTEVRRLYHLAQSTVNNFKSTTANNTNNNDSSTPASSSSNLKKKWKKAVDKVIYNQVKMQLLPIIEQLFSTPSNIRLLYAGQKLILPAKIFIDLHIYLHTTSNIIEIIGHQIKRKKKKKVVNLPSPSSSINNHNAVLVDHNLNHPLSPINENNQTILTILPMPRMYLQYNTLIGIVMGIDRFNSLIEEISIPSQETSLPSNNVAALPLFSNSPRITTNPTDTTSLMKMVGKNLGLDESDLTGDGAKKFNRTVEQAIVSFVSNRVKLNAIPNKGKDKENKEKEEIKSSKFTIYLDFGQINNSPIINVSDLPKDFTPVNLSIETLHKHYMKSQKF